MSKKKHKFDLTNIVHKGYLKEGESLYYVSDPTKSCTVVKIPNGEYKVKKPNTANPVTIFAYAQECLGMEPPDHASRWFRTAQGKTLYELWQAEEGFQEAA